MTIGAVSFPRSRRQIRERMRVNAARAAAMYPRMTLAEIARELNCSDRTVLRLLATVPGLERVGRGGRYRGVRARHGSASRYTAGCRCEACRAANRERGRALRARLREAS